LNCRFFINKYGGENMSLLPLLPAAAILTLGLGFGLGEKRLLESKLSRFNYRVNVTGTRGKSTVTRLLVSALLANGTRTMGKATGSEARVLGFDECPSGSLIPWEKEFRRPPEGANINEVRRLVKDASAINAEALVVECMAIDPDYQQVFCHDFLRANVTVIVNVLEDHMEVLGPSLKEAAEAFAANIPENGLLVTVPGDFLPYFEKAAAAKNSRVAVADTTELPAGFCRQFPYHVFPETLALAFKAATALGVDKETALKGMLKAQPDPGVLRLQKINARSNGVACEGLLVKAFAANDPSSAVKIWQYYQAEGLINGKTVVLMNCRGDRVERSDDFARKALPLMKGQSLLLMGEATKKVLAFEKHTPLSGSAGFGRDKRTGYRPAGQGQMLRQQCFFRRGELLRHSQGTVPGA
jgi:gamma-polyglutamate synthase